MYLHGTCFTLLTLPWCSGASETASLSSQSSTSTSLSMQIEQARDGLKEVNGAGANGAQASGPVDARSDLLEAIKKGLSLHAFFLSTITVSAKRNLKA